MPVVVGFTSIKKFKRSDIPGFVLKASQGKKLGLKKRNKNDILVLSYLSAEEYKLLKPTSIKNVKFLFEPKIAETAFKTEQLDLGI